MSNPINDHQNSKNQYSLLMSAMESGHIFTVFLLLLGSISSEQVEKLCKVICNFKRLNYAEISMEKNTDKVKLSKGLAAKCSMSIKFVSSLRELGTNNFIAFAYHEADKKENL